MTCIVGLINEGAVYIGGDSAGAASTWSLVARADRKVFATAGYVLGFTDSFRMGQLLQHGMTFPPLPDASVDLHRFMVNEFVEAVRSTLKVGGYAKTSDGRDEGGTFLVGCRGHLFRIESDFQVGESLDGYDACGGGEEVARGSLFTTRGWWDSPKQRVTAALEAAEHHNASVRPPFHLEILPSHLMLRIATPRGGSSRTTTRARRTQAGRRT